MREGGHDGSRGDGGRRRHRQCACRPVRRRRPDAGARQPADRHEPAGARARRAGFRRHLARGLRIGPLRARKGRRARRGGRRDQLRCHLLAGGARPAKVARLSLDQRRCPLERRRLARPSRDRRGPGMHRDRPPGAGFRRRHDVARDGDPQADVAEAPPAGAVATLRAAPRPCRFPDLAGQRLQCPLLLHADLQMDLPGPRDAGLAGRLSGRGGARGPARAGGAAGSREPDRCGARPAVARGRRGARPFHRLPGRLRPDRRPCRRARRARRGPWHKAVPRSIGISG